MNDVVAAFHEYFEIIDANSPELLREVFRLRYQVLCVEQRAPGFEPSNYPDGLESDQYDRHSSHILLRHRPSRNTPRPLANTFQQGELHTSLHDHHQV